MAKKPVTNPTEVKFAIAFLRYLHANSTNTYLVLAVVAWLRAESGQHYIGWNPLNLRPGKDDAKYRVGIRQTKGNGQFSIYGSLLAGARATANRLLGAGNDYRGYGSIVAAAQRGGGTTTQSQQQAQDFLNAIALSRWDSGHYGLGRGTLDLATVDLSKNKLVKIWAGLLGYPVIIPADPTKPPPKPAPPKPVQQMADVRQPHYNFINPYAAGHFYRERHPADKV